MGEHVIGRTVQTSKKFKYQPGADVCNCFHCTIFTDERPCLETGGVRDWEIDDPAKSCCGGLCRPQPVCVHPDRSECFIGLDNQKQDPLLRVEWDQRAPRLKCVYDLDKINSRRQVQRFTEKFGTNNDVEARYCTQKVTTCPNGIKACSRLISTGEGGDECRKWFQAQPASVRDATIHNYCLRHDTEDCRCVNRSLSQSYQDLKGAKVFSDGCWYVPCSNPSRYLVPSHLVNPSCPTEMCTQIFDFIKTGNVSFNDVKNDINCRFKTPPTPPAPPPAPTPTPPAPTPVPPLKAGRSPFLEYWKELSVLLLCVFFLVVLR